MGRKVLIAVMVATFALVGVQAAFAASTQITARYSADTETFRGKVTSGNDECLPGRKVKVFKKTADGKVLQGKTTTNANGGWKLEVMSAHGKYIAVTPEYVAMDDSICALAKSDVVDVM